MAGDALTAAAVAVMSLISLLKAQGQVVTLIIECKHGSLMSAAKKVVQIRQNVELHSVEQSRVDPDPAANKKKMLLLKTSLTTGQKAKLVCASLSPKVQ